jgi:hypothetical protein
MLLLDGGNRAGFENVVSFSKTTRLRMPNASFNPLTPELNPFAQRCLTRFFTADFAS